MICQKLILGLVDIANSKGQPERAKEYWNSYYCLDKVYCEDGRLYGKYCKSRICPVCSGNRKAELINKYYPELRTWKDPHFVTITIKAVKAQELKKWMEAVIRGFRLITQKYRKREQRGKSFRLKGIKSLECNYNPEKKTYNPHFHLIVPDEMTADIIIREWRNYCNRKGKFLASRKAQHKERTGNLENCLIEVIKYGSKIFTKQKLEDINTKAETGIKTPPPTIYLRAIHNILTAMKGIRLFDRFGFNLPKRGEAVPPKLLYDYDLMVFDPKVNDWIDSESELRLTEYNIPPELSRLLNSCIDIKFE